MDVMRGALPSDVSPATLGARTVESTHAWLPNATTGREERVPRDRPTWYEGLA